MILIQPSIDPVILSIGVLDIRWYSLAYILAFILGSIFLKKLNRNSYKLLSDIQIDRFFIWAVIGVIIGGRIGYVIFYQTNLFFADLGSPFTGTAENNPDNFDVSGDFLTEFQIQTVNIL